MVYGAALCLITTTGLSTSYDTPADHFMLLRARMYECNALKAASRAEGDGVVGRLAGVARPEGGTRGLVISVRVRVRAAFLCKHQVARSALRLARTDGAYETPSGEKKTH